MTRYLLDTNIISDAVKPVPSPKLAKWMIGQNDADLCIAAMSLAEIWRGILLLPLGRKRTGLETWFAGPEGPSQLFRGRIMPFEERAALIWGRLMVDAKTKRMPFDVTDMHIAAVAEANGCVVVTANEADFKLVPYLNPMSL